MAKEISFRDVHYDLLVLERDDTAYSLIARGLLDKNPNFQIRRASSWSEAKQASADHRYDRFLFSLSADTRPKPYVESEMNHLRSVLGSGHEASAILLAKNEDDGLIAALRELGVSAIVHHPLQSFERFDLDLVSQVGLLNYERDRLTKLVTEASFTRSLDYFFHRTIEQTEPEFLKSLQNKPCKNGCMEYVDFPLSVIYLDIDGFKPINDLYGHSAGDEILMEIGRILSARDAAPIRTDEQARGTARTVIRATDIASRLHGDEFAIILPNTNEHGALTTAEKVCRAITDSPYGPFRQKTSDMMAEAYIGATAGIAPIWVPRDEEEYAHFKRTFTGENLKKSADLAMQDAKPRDGRDTIFTAQHKRYSIGRAKPGLC